MCVCDRESVCEYECIYMVGRVYVLPHILRREQLFCFSYYCVLVCMCVREREREREREKTRRERVCVYVYECIYTL